MSFRHTPALVRLKPHGARGEHRENELFLKVSVGSVAKQSITYARGLMNKKRLACTSLFLLCIHLHRLSLIFLQRVPPHQHLFLFIP
jgi:hypothetical protein